MEQKERQKGMQEKIFDLGLGKDLLEIPPKSRSTKSQIDKLHIIKI